VPEVPPVRLESAGHPPSPRPSPSRGEGVGLRGAERACAELARREAKNFYWGFIALPREKRNAIYALYGFARQVDDEVDLKGRAEAGLAEQRRRLRACLAGDRPDPVMVVLGQAVERYEIPAVELEALIDGVEMDLRRRRYETWAELESYCRLVASMVGRMCVRIFGFRDPVALDHADQLGLALQLINVLRDVAEDAAMDRVYLPAEEMQRFEVDETDLLAGRPGPGWEPLVRFEAERARSLFASGLEVCEHIPSSSAACVRTMAGIYGRILDQVEADPRRPLRERISLSTAAKLGVVVRSWLGR
jgi:phytoene synthase